MSAAPGSEQPGLQRDVPLQALNTLALPGRAAQFLRIVSPAQLNLLPPAPARFVLGGGSNLVLRGDYPGLVLQMAIPGREVLGRDDTAVYLAAGAGENWHDFVGWSLEQGCPGLENLALIPGTVGAAPVQNIGAYGLEVGERIAAVEAFDFQRGEVIQLPAAACEFAYRHSRFKQEPGRWAIVRVIFRLPCPWQARLSYAELAREVATLAAPDARQIAAAVCAIRRRKLPDPQVLANAGSFFQNPVVSADHAAGLKAQFPTLPAYPQADGQVKLAAGWLIEQAGWKGRQLGPVGMYEKQALVLVNHGGASGADVQRLTDAVRADVREKFHVELQPEPVFL
ncbi:MAG: hypothetical protein RIR00_1802 [Pseudomonadota bacterium]